LANQEEHLPLVAGEPVEVLPGIRRLLAPNPSMMTGPGTNTYLIGTEDLIVIDPGPEDEVHLARIAELAQGRIRYVVISHSHRDHAPGAAPLARAVGATLLGFDVRPGFAPDGRVGEGDVLVTDRWRLTAMHTPGHSSDHLCFVADATTDGSPRVVFSGDHIMEGSTVVIGPLDGDMTQYFDSLHRLRDLAPPCEFIAPGHGHLIANPQEVIDFYLKLRLEREESIFAALLSGPKRVSELIPLFYDHLPERLQRHGGRSIWAHLRKLNDEGRVVTSNRDEPESVWAVPRS
jgi:glyoxylase-like metal-dependent hydrolase (beta-lactamase superfamily II)